MTGVCTAFGAHFVYGLLPTRAHQARAPAHRCDRSPRMLPEVVVVGGGFAGLSAAYTLVKRGITLVANNSRFRSDLARGMPMCVNSTSRYSR